MLKVAGYNNNCLCTNENIKDLNGSQIVNPPGNSNLDLSSLLSYSVYCYHAVWVTKDGHAYSIGDNSDKQIFGDLQAQVYDKPVEIKILNKNGHRFIPLSAVCGRLYTLYLIQSAETPLVYVHSKRKGVPLFLNINGLRPIKLFGGMTNAAVVCEDGSIVFINESILESDDNQPEIFKLPDEGIPIDISCCDDHIVAISKSGNAYQINLLRKKPLKFKAIKECKKHHFIFIGGCQNSNFAVTNSGHVYGRGENANGKLGLDKESWGSDRYTEIKELKKYKIVKAFSGNFHSLFITDDGKVIGCGRNRYGELLIENNSDVDSYYSPVETSIESGANFAIVGDGLSCVFVNCEPPENQPNTVVDYEKKLNLDYVEEEEEIEEEEEVKDNEKSLENSDAVNRDEQLKESSEVFENESSEKSIKQKEDDESENETHESSEEQTKQKEEDEEEKEIKENSEETSDKQKDEKSERSIKESSEEVPVKQEDEKSEKSIKESSGEVSEQKEKEESEEASMQKDEKSERSIKKSSEEVPVKQKDDKSERSIKESSEEVSEQKVKEESEEASMQKDEISERSIKESSEEQTKQKEEDETEKDTKETSEETSAKQKDEKSEKSIKERSEKVSKQEEESEKETNESSEEQTKQKEEIKTTKEIEEKHEELPKQKEEKSENSFTKSIDVNDLQVEEVTENGTESSEMKDVTDESQKDKNSSNNESVSNGPKKKNSSIIEIPKETKKPAELPIKTAKEVDPFPSFKLGLIIIIIFVILMFFLRRKN